ncbi:MAG TPA: L-lactate dehydrogenase [Tenericutes bacterium]|nr:L-lactate dehydrogenase [Mycoplasmatota bacterium]
MNNKVVIIGCGNVGMSYAYALLNQRTSVNDLVLIDINKKKVEGEVMDLNHCLAFAPSKINIKVGDYTDCSDAKIICIAAGANQNPGETRMDLITKNAKVFKNIINSVMETGFNGIFLIATNPLDVMTYLTWKYSKLDTSQIIGSGTSLDTARLRYMIGERLNINPKNVHAYVIGEHGDSEFVPWSIASIGLQSIYDFLNEEELNKICTDVKNAAYEIIDRKGATYYGIGMCLVRITNAILSDENSIITVSSYDSNNNVFVGGPTIINKNGIRERVFVNLTQKEERQLQKSIDIIKEAIRNID